MYDFGLIDSYEFPQFPDTDDLGVPPAAMAAEGTPWLPDELPDGFLIVRIAFGADISQDYTGWPWRDYTTSVLQMEDGTQAIEVTVVRAPQGSSAFPALATLSLKNPDGNFTPYNPASVLWPNVRENTPVWVLLRVGGTLYTRFFGFSKLFAPEFDSTGNAALVRISAYGRTNIFNIKTARLQSDSLSPLHIAVLATDPLYYWPLEDGAGATNAASGLPDSTPLIITGTGGTNMIGAISTIPGSLPLPDFALPPDGIKPAFVAATDGGSDTAWQVSCVVIGTAATDNASEDILQFNTDGTVAATRFGIRLYVRTTAPNTFSSFSAKGNGGTWAATDMVQQALDGNYHHVAITGTQSGSDSVIKLYVDGRLAATTTVAGTTIGKITSITLGRFTTLKLDSTTLGLGHVSIHSTDTAIDLTDAMTGYNGETCDTRLARLGTQLSVPVTIIGSNAIAMGVQGVTPPIGVFRECEAAADASIYDGLEGGGLLVVHNNAQYGVPPVMELDASQGQLQPPFNPLVDGTGRVNIVAVSRKDGGSAVYKVTSGDLGTDAIGQVRAGPPAALVVASDDVLMDRASWEAAKGTEPGFRFPRMVVDMRKQPARIIPWLNTLPGARVEVVPPYQPKLPPDNIRAIITGYTERISKKVYTVALNTVPGHIYDIWTPDTVGTEYSRLAATATTIGNRVAAGAGDELGSADGTFESGVSGWTPTGATFEQSSAQAHGGTYSGLLTAAGGTQAYARPTAVAVQAGNTYRLVFWAYSPAGYATLSIAIDWYLDGAYVSTTASTSAIAAATWTEFVLDVTAPTGVNSAAYGPTLAGTPGAGTTLYVDDVTFVETLTFVTDSASEPWTDSATYPDDFPLYVRIGGIKVTVATITGTASPQVAVVSGVTKTLNVSDTVELYQPNKLGL